MNEELKPCPFCGSKTLFPREVYLGKITGKRWYVWCKNCGAFGSSRNTKQESIDAWNRRAMPLTMPPHVISEIEKAAKAIHDCVEVCNMCVAYGKCGLIGIDHEAYQCRTAIARALARAAGWSV